MEALLLQILQAAAPSILGIIEEQFRRTGSLPTAEQLNAKIVAQADKIIQTGQSWLDTHKG